MPMFYITTSAVTEATAKQRSFAFIRSSLRGLSHSPITAIFSGEYTETRVFFGGLVRMRGARRT